MVGSFFQDSRPTLVSQQARTASIDSEDLLSGEEDPVAAAGLTGLTTDSIVFSVFFSG